MCYLITFLNWTPTFVGVRLDEDHNTNIAKDTCLKKIEICLQNLSTQLKGPMYSIHISWVIQISTYYFMMHCHRFANAIQLSLCEPNR